MGRCGILLIAVFVMALFGAEPIASQSITGLSELSAAKRKTSNPQRAANDDDNNGDEKKGNRKDD